MKRFADGSEEDDERVAVAAVLPDSNGWHQATWNMTAKPYGMVVRRGEDGGHGINGDGDLGTRVSE